MLGADKSLGYFHREVFSVCYVLAALWPLMYGADFIRQNAVLLATWALCCIAMSAFTLLPVVKVEDITLMYVGSPPLLLLRAPPNIGLFM